MTTCPHGRPDDSCPPIYCDMQPIDPLTGVPIIDVHPLTIPDGTIYPDMIMGQVQDPHDRPMLAPVRRRDRRAAVLRR